MAKLTVNPCLQYLSVTSYPRVKCVNVYHTKYIFQSIIPPPVHREGLDSGIDPEAGVGSMWVERAAVLWGCEICLVRPMPISNYPIVFSRVLKNRFSAKFKYIREFFCVCANIVYFILIWSFGDLEATFEHSRFIFAIVSRHCSFVATQTDKHPQGVSA